MGWNIVPPDDRLPDGDLVRRVLAGSTAAYAPLVSRYSARVLAVCHARVGRTAAEDLAQESLLRALRGLATLNEPEKFGSWLTGIAVRTCLDWLKAARQSEVSLESIDEVSSYSWSGTDDLSIDDRREQTDRLMAQVEQLPPLYREVIMHYYYKRCTYQELADVLGVSAATINARLTRARAMLRERMLAERE